MPRKSELQNYFSQSAIDEEDDSEAPPATQTTVTPNIDATRIPDSITNKPVEIYMPVPSILF